LISSKFVTLFTIYDFDVSVFVFASVSVSVAVSVTLSITLSVYVSVTVSVSVYVCVCVFATIDSDATVHTESNVCSAKVSFSIISPTIKFDTQYKWD